jgi:hypothetical protein
MSRFGESGLQVEVHEVEAGKLSLRLIGIEKIGLKQGDTIDASFHLLGSQLTLALDPDQLHTIGQAVANYFNSRR